MGTSTTRAVVENPEARDSAAKGSRGLQALLTLFCGECGSVEYVDASYQDLTRIAKDSDILSVRSTITPRLSASPITSPATLSRSLSSRFSAGVHTYFVC